ncbi:MAG: hypothetical protein ACOZAM_03705 [Pseudomonadota bacterium]
MRITRLVLSIISGLMILLGLVWVGQGSGYFPYPATSFMINQAPWIYWGLLLAVAGVVLFVIARRLGRG